MIFPYRSHLSRVKVEYPLKQGLKPFHQPQIQLRSGHVKVEYPLKQGLKHFSSAFFLASANVKVEYPLK